MFTYILFTTLLTYITQSINKYPPIWVTSPYIKADCFNVISVPTDNTSTPTATIPFPAGGNTFTKIPNLGYGAFIY